MEASEPSFVYAGVTWIQPNGRRNFPACFTVLPAVGDIITAMSEGSEVRLRVKERSFSITQEMEAASIWLTCTLE